MRILAMDTKNILNQLQGIASSANFSEQASALTQKWSGAPDSFDAVVPILQFMEGNPSLDYGMPGPLVHFLEEFLGKGYEQKLTQSIDRRPTSHTVWMLNRVINGTKSPEEKKHLIELLRKASTNPTTDIDARSIATRFLDRLWQPM